MFTVAKSLPRSCRNLQKTQNLLVLCSPQCNHVQQRNVFWRKKFVWNEDMKFNLYKDYDFSYEGIKGMLLNKTRKAYEKEQGYLEARVNMLGPDIAAAEMILLWKGKVKFVDDEIWYEAYESGQLPLPKQYDPGYRLEAVDLSNTNWTLLAMEHFRYLDHLVYVNLSGAQFVTDWGYISGVTVPAPSRSSTSAIWVWGSPDPNMFDNFVSFTK
ncbi:hypothetical protein MAR_001470 [Mya arenaria]|uniref:Uncharacterized protein n=1 Tax=Mya arenaria TaxID=6604 RepID=A0ABY7FF75_MYAAR|nr:hypothetical protein MAR_001470 [Mya arenaria]